MGQRYLGAMVSLEFDVVVGKERVNELKAFRLDSLMMDPLTMILRNKRKFTILRHGGTLRLNFAALLIWALRCMAFEGLRPLVIPQWLWFLRGGLWKVPSIKAWLCEESREKCLRGRPSTYRTRRIHHRSSTAASLGNTPAIRPTFKSRLSN